MDKNSPAPSGKLESIIGQFSNEQIRLIMSNVGAIELTDGCSIGCGFCGFEANKGIRDYIQPEVFRALVKRFKEELRETGPSLYYASDPFDYNFEGLTYPDIHQIVLSELGYNPYVSTAVPKGTENLVIDLLLDNRDKESEIEKYKEIIDVCQSIIQLEKTGQRINEETYGGFENQLQRLGVQKGEISRIFSMPEGSLDDSKVGLNMATVWPKSWIISRMSIGSMNSKRLARIFNDRFPEINPDNQKSTDYFLEEQPYYSSGGGGYLLKNMAQIESDLGIQLFVDGRIFVVGEGIGHTRNGRPIVHVGENRHQNRGKIYSANINGRHIVAVDRPVNFVDLVQAHVNGEDYGRGVLDRRYNSQTQGPQRLGQKNIEELSEYGIGCFHGVLIRTSGFYNVVTCKPYRENPTGQMISLISPLDFFVTRFRWFNGGYNGQYEQPEILHVK